MVEPDDEVLEALRALDRTVEENLRRLRLMQKRLVRLREQRRSGAPYADIVRQAEPPLLVELVSKNLESLQRVGHQLRAAEARALHAEGLTMDEIADLFGVTRQRISSILRGDSSPAAPGFR